MTSDAKPEGKQQPLNMTYYESYCPHFHHVVELVGRRWTGVILRQLAGKPSRFGDIKSDIPGLSDRLLASRLNELEAEGVITRTEQHGQVLYALSEKGDQFLPVLEALQRVSVSWGQGHEPAEHPGRIRALTRNQ